MPKYIYVQIQGVDKPARIVADAIEKDGHLWVLKNGSVKVGEFHTGTVVGWWIQEENTPPSY